MNAIELALVELRTRMVFMAPIHEGLRDYASLNLTPTAMEVIHKQLRKYDEMLAAMQAAEAALKILLALHYPDLSPVSVPKAELDDIQNQVDTLTAARAQFKSLAVSGTIEFGPEQ